MRTEIISIIGMWVNISRAYEIAKLGGFSIRVVYDHDYMEFVDDYPLIKEFYNDVEFSGEGEITVEAIRPIDFNDRANETLTTLHTRVNKASKVPLAVKKQNDAVGVLLNTVIKKHKFSLSEIKLVDKMAKVIAQLDLSKVVRPEHMAEATHYVYKANDYRDYVIAESNTLNFGNGIFISLENLYNLDIEKAIKHLKSRIK